MATRRVNRLAWGSADSGPSVPRPSAAGSGADGTHLLLRRCLPHNVMHLHLRLSQRPQRFIDLEGHAIAALWLKSGHRRVPLLPSAVFSAAPAAAPAVQISASRAAVAAASAAASPAAAAALVFFLSLLSFPFV